MFSRNLGRIAGVIEKRLLLIAALALALLAGYKALSCMGTGSSCVTPTVLDSVLLGLIVLLVLILHGFARRMGGRKVIAVILAASLASQVAMYTFSMDTAWHDPRGYVEGAAEIQEKGLPYFLENYHHFCGFTLITMEDMEKVDADLERYGLETYREEVRDPEMCGVAPDRRSQHPPFWMIVISLFFLVLGASDISALIAMWVVSALVPVALYLLLKEVMPGRSMVPVSMSFLLMVSPFFLLSTYAPFNRTIIMLFALVSTLFLARSVKRGGIAWPVLTGLALSLAIVTNLVFTTFYLPFLIVIILCVPGWRARARMFGMILLASAVMPLALMPLGYSILVNVITAKHAIDRFHLIREPVYSGLIGLVVEKLKFIFWISLPVTLLGIARITRLVKERSLGKEGLMAATGLAFLIHLAFVMTFILSQEVTFKHMVFALPLLYVVPAGLMEKQAERGMIPLLIALTFIQTAILLFT
jgi:hypothetical protein